MNPRLKLHHHPVESEWHMPAAVWLLAAVCLLVIVGIGLALADGFPLSALWKSDLTSTERVVRLGTLARWP